MPDLLFNINDLSVVCMLVEFLRIQHAYDILSDDDAKKALDNLLRCDSLH